MFTFSLGKGLREPCSPFRQLPIFGQPATPSTSLAWNCLPEPMEPARQFDLSGITEGHEVVVALLTCTGLPPGYYTSYFTWHRVRDGRVIASWEVRLAVPQAGQASFYSWIGWFASEISENGDYSAEVVLEGPAEFRQVLPFTVSGIPPEPPPPEPVLFNPFALLRNASAQIANSLASLAWELSINILLSWTAVAIGTLARWANDVTFYLSLASDWLEDVEERLHQGFSWQAVRALILSWLPWLADAAAWFSDVSGNLLAVVNSWWSTAQSVVLDWIDALRNEVIDITHDMIDINHLFSWWESVQVTVREWIDDTRTSVLNAVEVFISPVRDAVNRHENVIRLLTDADDVALRWLLERIETMIARLW